jgi:ribosome-binding protein aMBF1 (putative translation factor)
MPKKNHTYLYERLTQDVEDEVRRSERHRLPRREVSREVAIANVRRARSMTQGQLTRSLGLTQAGVGRLEHDAELYVATLRSYLEAMGGSLELTAVFDDEQIPLPLTEG